MSNPFDTLQEKVKAVIEQFLNGEITAEAAHTYIGARLYECETFNQVSSD